MVDEARACWSVPVEGRNGHDSGPRAEVLKRFKGSWHKIKMLSSMTQS